MLKTKAAMISRLEETEGDFAAVRELLEPLPRACRHTVRCVGAVPHPETPAFLYACTADDRLWRIDDCNIDYVANITFILSTENFTASKPFPVVFDVDEDGRLQTDDIRHIDKEGEERMIADEAYAQRVLLAWQQGHDPGIEAARRLQPPVRSGYRA